MRVYVCAFVYLVNIEKLILKFIQKCKKSKIFKIISRKTKPEDFHYQVTRPIKKP